MQGTSLALAKSKMDDLTLPKTITLLFDILTMCVYVEVGTTSTTNNINKLSLLVIICERKLATGDELWTPTTTCRNIN